MPREAKLFEKSQKSQGSPARAWFKLTANIPPNWIERAQHARKRRESDVAAAMKQLRRLLKTRPGARQTIKTSKASLRVLLRDWELSYRKESFYNGLRILLELSRDGESAR
jgi:hypothetical protein